MSLRVLAALDAAAIVQDDATGFGWPVMVTSPDGVTAGLVGLSTDIQHSIDPDTGTPITARRASVSLVTAAVIVAFGAVPRGIADGASKPWLVRFADIHGTPQTFKVRETAPDRAIGLTTCILEWYRAG